MIVPMRLFLVASALAVSNAFSIASTTRRLARYLPSTTALEGTTLVEPALVDDVLVNEPALVDEVKTPTISRTSKPAKQREVRTIRGVNPFFLSPREAEFLSCITLYMNQYNMMSSVAYSTVARLWNNDDVLQNIQEFGSMSTRASDVTRLITQPGEHIVQEDVQILKVDSSGQLQLDKKIQREAVIERISHLISEDMRNVREGIYPVPSELRLPKRIGTTAVMDFLQDVNRGLNFANGKYSGKVDYSKQWSKSSYYLELASGLDLPDYYTEFHSVPGGFLSEEHAAIYDLLSEVVFLGMFQALRRMAIRPIVEEARRRGRASGRGLKLLDIGTGTGTFLIQVKEALGEMELEGLDLSPAMLNQGRKYFRTHPTTRNREAPRLRRGNMESIPMEDATLDFVTETNCFHEMPEDAIRNTIEEVSRVLKKDGMFIHGDAVQREDDFTVASVAGVTFDESFNEPFMHDWMFNVDLDSICEAAGLVPAAPPRAFFSSGFRCYRKL